MARSAPVVSVRLGSHSEQLVQEFYDAIVATAQVLQVFHLAGSSDFLVHVAVADAAELRDLVLRHITVHRGGRRVRSAPQSGISTAQSWGRNAETGPAGGRSPGARGAKSLGGG